MADPNALAVDQHAQDVKTVVIGRASMTVDPDLSGFRQLFLLPPVNRGYRPAKVRSLSCLDLDERHRPVLFNYQIDVAATVPKTTVHNPPTAPPEPSLRDPLTQFPECLLG